VTWNRTAATAAIVAAVAAALGETVFVYSRPPQTINPPAVVVGRPDEVLYAMSAFGVDEASLPVLCVGPADGEDVVDSLLADVRAGLADPMLGGAVQSCVPALQRNWRNMTVAGIDILQAELVLTIRM